MASPFSRMWRCCVLFMFLVHLLDLTLGDIRYTNISSKNRTRKHIDTFKFRETGRLELNISHISLSYPTHLNLSTIGFFVSTNRYLFGDFDGALGRCFFDPLLSSNYSINTLYTFDQLQLQQGLNSHSYSFDVAAFGQTNQPITKLFFQNCHSDVQVSMEVQSAMYNFHKTTGSPSYLSGTKTFQFWFYSMLLLLYFCLAGKWGSLLFNDKKPNTLGATFSVMLLSLVLKLTKILLHLLYLAYIDVTGSTQGWSVVLALLSGLFTEIPILPVVVYEFNRYRNKTMLRIIILVEVSTSICRTLILNRGPCGMQCFLNLSHTRLLDNLVIMVMVILTFE